MGLAAGLTSPAARTYVLPSVCAPHAEQALDN